MQCTYTYNTCLITKFLVGAGSLLNRALILSQYMSLHIYVKCKYYVHIIDSLMRKLCTGKHNFKVFGSPEHSIPVLF